MENCLSGLASAWWGYGLTLFFRMPSPRSGFLLRLSTFAKPRARENVLPGVGRSSVRCQESRLPRFSRAPTHPGSSRFVPTKGKPPRPFLPRLSLVVDLEPESRHSEAFGPSPCSRHMDTTVKPRSPGALSREQGGKGVGSSVVFL